MWTTVLVITLYSSVWYIHGHTQWFMHHNFLFPKVASPSQCLWRRARHLLFPQLGSRTTIKQYGLVRNRNLLGHYDNILPFSIKNRGELYISIFNFLFQDYCEAHCHIINHWCSSLECFFYVCPFWRHRDQEYISRDIKLYNIKHFNSERWKK